ncbi:toll/interleukin-1 receptor domain-containing protein [Heliobacterium chlorum]|uniref:Toll/interleukin-1 receptor domain-containing protein n=1 Tax=Heliobacterium chlorum TaxID=2698 RepID=A0ABR7T815_HELCL|nr:toll/interleukin-1 receptor domain-containing protein [Heliobacterium chlorum]
MKDFFISYNKTDHKIAEWIAWILEEAGYSVVIQAWDFTVGINFIVMMDEAAKLANRTITVLSPDYLKSDYTPAEWAAAFNRDPRGVHGTLLPVLVRECNLEGLLAQIIYIKLTGLDEQQAKEVLLNGVSPTRRKPARKPKFPLG